MDGYVAFFIPNIDDEVPNRNPNKDIIAPLWTDLDSDSGGRWTYEQATSGPLIAQTNKEINRMFPNVYFSASWVFVSTWENVPLEFSAFQGATLQIILASDCGGQSFILMNYGTIPSIPSSYWLAGYGRQNNIFVTIPVNSAPELSSSSNVNIPGRWAFQFTGSPLFQVGPGATQLFLSDGMYQTIQLQQTFNYGGNTYSQLYLSMDGYVAFFVPNIDDEVPNQNLNKGIIAPLWTDLDSDSGGRWTYEQATSGPLIAQANLEINRMFPNVYFSASWVFVSTWENVPLEFSGFQGATLQIILASNGGGQSFILMNYGTIPTIPSPYWLAGYGMENSSFVTIPVNSAPELSSSSNVNIPGRWAFQFTGSPLFQVGPGATQLVLSDGMYQTIQLQQTFNYGGNTYSQLYLSMDGYVAFFIPNIDDEVPNRNLNKDIIAPLWTDLDSDSGGRWTYEQATSGPLIAQTNHEINRMFPNVYFSASWVFVSTWENVPLEFSGFQGATLQIVLASNGGGLSFILMNYGTIPSIPSPYWLAGYGMEHSNFFTIPVNSAPELSSSSNVNIPGRWAFQFTAHCQTLNCTQDEVCRKINGAYGCACGNIPTGNPLIYDSVETCSGSAGSLSLSRCQLFEAGYSADVLHLNDPSCKGQVENNRLVFYFDSNANMCGTTLKNNNTHIIFENSIGTVNGIGLISRSGGLSITFSCVYLLIQSISMPTDISATGSIISKDLSTEGSYQISMIPYTDATFLVPFSGNVTLQINHQMYIAVEVNPFDSNQIALVLDNCWATPVNQTDYSIRWDLIINECPNPNDDTVEVLQNGVSTSSHFSFRMFTFTSFSNKIYLHCQVHLCLKESGNCALPCTGNLSRKRRSVDFYDSAAITMEF
ncbi:alpha-tectorin-like [Silurus meridionalis]|uniref:alpha-tectorin-like n=1 Tax=Silurus meridionalis TaxID=175797 RepID=UPI001EE9CAA5|nr:alpha-tectorin-like [Silurus meridionalis]